MATHLVVKTIKESNVLLTEKGLTVYCSKRPDLDRITYTMRFYWPRNGYPFSSQSDKDLRRTKSQLTAKWLSIYRETMFWRQSIKGCEIAVAEQVTSQVYSLDQQFGNRQKCPRKPQFYLTRWNTIGGGCSYTSRWLQNSRWTDIMDLKWKQNRILWSKRRKLYSQSFKEKLREILIINIGLTNACYLYNNSMICGLLWLWCK